MGRRLRKIRHIRGTSLPVVAGLAGISPKYLSQLESGTRALDRHCLIVALAAVDSRPIAELIARSREDSVGRELRGMVHCAGLPQ
ncbi:MAG: helix-turn-helix domain-containing protein [Pseudonocardiaceae bacterium]